MKNKKLIVRFTLYILFITVTLFSQENTNNINSIFQSSEQIWMKSFSTDINDFVIVPATGDIIILSSDQKSFNLSYHDNQGKEVWNISQRLDGGKGRKVSTIIISENAETIIVHGGSAIEEASQNWIFTKEGILVFNELTGDGYYYPSPSGNYLSYESGDGFSNFALFHRDGTQLALDVPEVLKVKRQKQRFIDENLVLVYREVVEDNQGIVELLLVHIPDMNIKWRRRINSRLWLVNFNKRNCATNEKYIAVQGSLYGSGGIVVLSKETGEVMWGSEDHTSNSGLGFTPDGEFLVTLTQGKYLTLINIKDRKITDSVRLFKNGLIAGFKGFLWADNTLAIKSHYVAASDREVFGSKGHVNGPYTAVINIDEGSKFGMTRFIEGSIQLRNPNINNKIFLYSTSGKTFNKMFINKKELESSLNGNKDEIY